MAGSITQEVVALNDFGFEERRRTTGSGTTNRYTVSIKAEPIVHLFDAKELGRGPAEAIAEAIRKGIRDIGEIASASTRARRASAAEALRRGASWAVARYSGGKTGPKEPNKTPRLFNDSGRLAEGIVAGPTRDNTWVINVTSNRFDPSTFVGGVSALVSMFERLRALVPALQGPQRLMEIQSVKDAIEGTQADIFISRGHALASQRRRLLADIRRGQVDFWINKIGGGIASL